MARLRSSRRTERPDLTPSDDPTANSGEPSRGSEGRSAQPPAARPASTGRQLGELLVTEGLIGPQDLQEALLAQGASGRRLGAELAAMRVIDEIQLAQARLTRCPRCASG
jgi:hypothetical protein